MHMLGSSVLLAYACYDLCTLSTYNVSVHGLMVSVGLCLTLLLFILCAPDCLSINIIGLGKLTRPGWPVTLEAGVQCVGQ